MRTPSADLGIPGIVDAMEVGRGGFAVVYRAFQTKFRRPVAVKVLTMPAADDGLRDRFDRECQAMGLLSDHPNIVTVHESGFTHDGRPYLVMAYLPGGSLADRLKSDGPLRPGQVVEIGIKVAGALDAAHAAGVLHRDVKPSNILLSKEGDPQLADFGIARLVGATIISRGLALTPAYASPEVLDGQSPSRAADVYSLAASLFELLAGRPAFVESDDDTFFALRARVASAPVPDLRPRGVPDALASAIERAMAKRPADRTPSAAAFAAELQVAADQAHGPTSRAPGTHLPADPSRPGAAPSLPTPLPVPSVSDPWRVALQPWAVVLTIAIVVLIGAAATFALTSRPSKRPTQPIVAEGTATAGPSTSTSGTMPATTSTTVGATATSIREAAVATPAATSPATMATPRPATPAPGTATGPGSTAGSSSTVQAAPLPPTPRAPSGSTSDDYPCEATQRTMLGHKVQYCPLWRSDVPVYDSPDLGNGARQVGTLIAGGSANWFVGQSERSSFTFQSYTNRWWAFTIADNDQWGWVPEVYFTGGADNERDAGLYLCNSRGNVCTAAG